MRVRKRDYAVASVVLVIDLAIIVTLWSQTILT
jgi:hypothetical protein